MSASPCVALPRRRGRVDVDRATGIRRRNEDRAHPAVPGRVVGAARRALGRSAQRRDGTRQRQLDGSVVGVVVRRVVEDLGEDDRRNALVRGRRHAEERDRERMERVIDAEVRQRGTNRVRARIDGRGDRLRPVRRVDVVDPRRRRSRVRDREHRVDRERVDLVPSCVDGLQVVRRAQRAGNRRDRNRDIRRHRARCERDCCFPVRARDRAAGGSDDTGSRGGR